MNRELKGLMAKFDINQERLALLLEISIPTLRNKIENKTFNQKEIELITNYFKKYDKNLTTQFIFFN